MDVGLLIRWVLAHMDEQAHVPTTGDVEEVMRRWAAQNRWEETHGASR